MKKHLYYPLVFAENYYISENGYIFYMNQGIKILPCITDGKIIVHINRTPYSLLNLMLEYFYTTSEIEKYDFTYTQDKLKPLRIPKRLIKKHDKNTVETIGISSDYYNCYSKAITANKRSKESIGKNDILFVLNRDNYSCVYCGKSIKGKSWHLDHVVPLSKNGKNEINNLSVSCKTCNLMKNSMIKKDFIDRCGTIYKKFNT